MPSTPHTTARPTKTLIIREATTEDEFALRRLAQLDATRVPAGGLLVAGDGSELVAAVRVVDGVAIANPFRHTAAAVELLRNRASQLRRANAPRPSSLAARLAGLVRRRAALPVHPGSANPPSATARLA